MRALFAGSFHPPTKGHIDIVLRGAQIFDEVVVAVMINSQKRYVIPPEARVEMLETCLKSAKNVRLVYSDGLTSELAEALDCGVLLRGVRDCADYEYELRQAEINKTLTGVESLFLPCNPALSAVASSIVMDIAGHGGDISAFVPPEIHSKILTFIGKGV